MKRVLPALAAAFCFVSAAPSAWTQPSAPPTFSADKIRAHMAYLASDELEGRDMGSKGYDLAATYVANQFHDMGLKPGGDAGSFLQTVKLVRHRTLERGTFRTTGKTAQALIEFDDFVAGATAHGQTLDIKGPAVFAGHGVVTAARDDFSGLNVRDKIVVVLDGVPPGLTPEENQFAASLRAKQLSAQQRGAVGLVVANLTAAARPKPATVRAGAYAWTWERPNGNAFYSGAPVLATLNMNGSKKLFAGSSCGEAVLAGGKAGCNLGLDIEATAAGELGEKRVSSNVIAIIVVSGHLDHLGISANTALPDRINNGAMDNAGGISTLIEGARAFATGPRPKRSIIFLAVTGEERGLIGSSYFSANPPVRKSRMIANVNLDMPVMTYDFIDVAAIGAEHSTIIDAVARAAGRMNIGISPDPVPRLGIFTRSDHYNFVLQGIPAVFLIGGFKNGGEFAFNNFYNNRYHRPDDDLRQAFDYNVAAKWSRLNYEIAWELANQPARPLWKKNDLFGARYGAQGTIER